MSVTTQAGVKLDINQVRDQLNKDRDTGKVSKGDYKKAMKGLNRIADSEKRGVNYQFTGEGRFKTVSGNGFSPSRNNAGVSVGTRLPITGKQVSKAMGYAQSVGLQVPETPTETKTEPNKTYVGHLGFDVPTLKFDGTGRQDAVNFGSNIKRSVGPVNPVVERDPEPFIQDAEKVLAENKNKANELTQQIWNAERELEKLTNDHNSKINDPWNVNFGSDFSINPKKLFYPEGDDQGINWGNKEEFAKKEAELRQKIAKLDGDLNAIEGGKYTRPHKKATYEGFKNGQTPTVDKLPTIGGPFIPDAYIPVGSMQTMAGTAKTALPNVSLTLPKPSSIMDEAVRGANQVITQSRIGAPASRLALNAPVSRLGLNAPATKTVAQLPPPSSVLSNVVRKGQIRYGTHAIVPPTRIGGHNVKQWNMGWGGATFAKGGKIRSFFGGGLNQVGKAGTDWAQKKFSNAGIQAPTTPYLHVPKSVSSNVTGDQPTTKFVPKSINPVLAPVKTTPSWGNKTTTWGYQGAPKKTISVDRTGIGSAYNDQVNPIDKGKLINMATGLYGAASLLTAKKPKWEKPKDLNLFIRPAQGDEDMVSRGNNAIDESVRMGTSNLRSRTGSDLSSYVQGTTAMVDNAGRAKASILGQNAQLKRQDEVRMAGEINHGKQINWQAGEQYTREKNLNDLNTYQNRVQGAQAAVNNSLQYGQNQRADEKNKAAEREMMNKRYGMVMLNLAGTLEDQGYTPEQIAKRLEQYKALSFAKGGSLADSTKLMEGAHKNVSAANRELSRMFREYSKLISMASIENIRQFNQNIRAINSRKNLTVFSR